MSDNLFRCRKCTEIGDADDKRGVTISNYSTKSSAKFSLCAKCFLELVNSIGVKLEWKEWPKREK